MSIRSQVYPPHARLAPYVTAYLTTAIDATGTQTVDLFPVGHPVLSFALDDLPVVLDEVRPVTGKWNLTGQLTRHHRLTVGGRYSYAYVLFRPYGGRLLGFPQDRLTDDFADVLTLVPGAATAQVYAQLAAVPPAEPAAAVLLLDAWLLTLLDAQPDLPAVLAPVVDACRRIEADGGTMPIQALAAAVGLSKSTLERQFRAGVGLTPKRYARVVRFNAAYQTLLQSTDRDWHAIVLQHAYFDQAHFIKEFRTFFGYTPSQVHRSLLNMADHVRRV